MHLKKLLISTLCISSCIATFMIPVYADDINNGLQGFDVPMDLMEYITSSKSNLSISSSGAANVLCTVSGNTGITKTEIKAQLQRKVNNKWTTISTWQSSGTRTCSLSKSTNVSKGYSYRVAATVKASKGSKSESKTIYSDAKYY